MSQVQKVLSGKRITLPEVWAKHCRIEEGDFVIVKNEGNRIIIIPADVKPKA